MGKVGDSVSKIFHLTFPTMIALTLQAKNPMRELLQLPNLSIPIIYLESEEITTGMHLKTQWATGS